MVLCWMAVSGVGYQPQRNLASDNVVCHLVPVVCLGRQYQPHSQLLHYTIQPLGGNLQLRWQLLHQRICRCVLDISCGRNDSCMHMIDHFHV